jgi:hypothetical protein
VRVTGISFSTGAYLDLFFFLAGVRRGLVVHTGSQPLVPLLGPFRHAPA